MPDAPRNEVQRLQTLLDTVRLLNSTLELKELTGIILEVVRTEIAVERISVFVVDRSRSILQPLVTQQLEDEAFSLPVGMGIAGTVAATGEVLDIENAYADPRFDRRFDGKSGYYTNDLFALPVCNRNGEVVGVLELLNRLRPISPADREFLLGISVYIGLALENSFLHSQTVHKPEVAPHVDREIRDPLTFAMGYFELAPALSDLPAAAWPHLEEVRRSLSEASVSALRFRESLDQQREALAPMNLSEELRKVGESRAGEWARHNIQTMLIAETSPTVYAHEQDIRLVLSFLVRNAETAILTSDSVRQLRIHSWGTGKNAHVSIEHKGPLGDLDRSPGFVIANSIVQRYKGQILVESAAGKGTIFLIEMPAYQESKLAD
jgi:GAF domain-containing protein